LRRLLDIEEIRQLKARYILFLDGHRYTDLRALFTDDVQFRAVGGSPMPQFEGRPFLTLDEWLEAVRTERDGKLRFHLVHTPLIELTSDATAHALWPFSSSALRGYYDEEYRREADRWKISSVFTKMIIPHDVTRLEPEAAASSRVEVIAELGERWTV
jgi:hypothetical protein